MNGSCGTTSAFGASGDEDHMAFVAHEVEGAEDSIIESYGWRRDSS